jgi:mannan endo-1,4-beta-mannosidase
MDRRRPTVVSDAPDRREPASGNVGSSISRIRRLSAVVVLSIGFDVAFISGIGIRAIGAEAQRDPFVAVEGAHFILQGHRFNVAGINNHYLTFGSEAEVSRVLDDAVAMGANVVRTFIQPVIGSLDGRSVPTIWKWRRTASSSDLGVGGSYVLFWDVHTNAMGINDGPDGLQRVDFLVTEARKRHLRLILAFVDFWAYTGGIQQMRAWYGSQDKYTFFFSDPRPREDYRRFVSHVLVRRNAISGVVYRDDPTILAWELANEPNIQPPSLMQDWTADMAAFVKSIDANHLVTSGGANSRPLNTDFDVPSLDFLTWHAYPAHERIPADQFDRVISSYCAAGRVRGKPVLLEEFGNARTDGDQAAIYAKWLDTIETDRNCGGWLVWRLVSRQDDGRYPVDDFDKFDIHNDGGGTWRALQKAAARCTSPPTP